jgi:release factor glutamine methyltransferase
MSATAATVRGLLSAAAARLASTDAARLEVERIMAAALERPRGWLYAHGDAVPDAAQAARFAELVGRRAAGEPLAYLIGSQGFWTLDLAVTPDVLIPRADTERLVELALQRIDPGVPARIADLGTGSGAIALALASERPLARVTATDASTAALAVAQGNARRLGLANVAFAQGDWTAALGTERFDLIASNPPYIRDGDPHLARGDLRHEPPAALASGRDGLDAIRTIVAQAPAHLQHGGWLLLEHGYDQGAAVRALLEAAGLIEIETARDIEARDRVSLGRVPD